MLIALINTSEKHNLNYKHEKENKKTISNKVHFLKSKLPARYELK